MSSTVPVPEEPGQHKAEETPDKAWVAFTISALSLFLAALLLEWTDTDPLEARDFVVALAASLTGGVATGLATWAKGNRPA